MSKAKCKNCGDIVSSTFRHDWNCCTCYKESQNLISDKRSEMGLDNNLVNPPKEFWDYVSSTSTGFFLDGGEDYVRCGGRIKDIEWIDDGSGEIE